MAYSGRYTLIDDQVVHHLDQRRYPEGIGTDLIRTFILVGDELTLSGDASGITRHLRWKRSS